jgi:hypothetical protein
MSAIRLIYSNVHAKEEIVMANILPFKKPAVKKLGLCQYGHHSWRIIKESQFDSKLGKLVTVYECKKCSKRKVKAI